MAGTERPVRLRPYDPAVDREALWGLKRSFETTLGDESGDDAKADRYDEKLTAEYRTRWLEWVGRCVADEPRCVTLAVADIDETKAGADDFDPIEAAASGAAVGYVFVLPERLGFVWDAAVVNELFVDPAYRGTGVADDLLEAAIELADDQDVPLDRLLLDVDHDNDRARRFYTRHDFEPWGEMLVREL